jgi:hypothetical protein
MDVVCHLIHKVVSCFGDIHGQHVHQPSWYQTSSVQIYERLSVQNLPPHNTGPEMCN